MPLPDNVYMRKYQEVQLKDINLLAAQIAAELRGGEILALIGPLGAGKTAFTKALGKKLSVKGAITSPTFELMHVFSACLPKAKKKVSLYHLDLYRTRNFREVKALGIAETWGRQDTVTIIEWADKISRHLPKEKTRAINFLPNLD